MVRKPPRYWICDVDPAAPLPEAATAIVAHRLTRVPEMISAIEDSELVSPVHVHQLRVSTRRADAALRAFRPCFGAKHWKRVRKRLRRLRDAAADTRTVDVHCETLKSERKAAADPDRETLAVVLRATHEARPPALELLEAAVARDTARKVERSTRKLLKSVRTPAEGTYDDPGRLLVLRDLAENRLRRHVHELTSVAGETLDWKGLHLLRLAAKRLRYSMELFASPLEDPSLLDLYDTVTEMQSALGRINDAHELALRVERVAADERRSMRDRLLHLAETYRTRREKLHAEFLAWWDADAARGAIEAIDRRVDNPSDPLGAGVDRVPSA
ncbi:MAG: CHAD domain-containing protein [Planctomycetes bacterium]|nr:CHAD domain-containing protein [Planctomycetota bacterium]